MTDAEAETPVVWPPDVKSQLVGKDPDAGKDWRQEEKGTTEDKMVGWHHRLDGHEFEQALGDGEGQGSLACCSPWDRRVGHNLATEQQLSLSLEKCPASSSLLFTVSLPPFPISSVSLSSLLAKLPSHRPPSAAPWPSSAYSTLERVNRPWCIGACLGYLSGLRRPSPLLRDWLLRLKLSWGVILSRTGRELPRPNLCPVPGGCLPAVMNEVQE